MRSEPSGLCARAVWYAYDGRPAVRDLTLCLVPGEMTALAGPNGSGKTSFLKVLSGVRRPEAGQVTLDGVPLFSLHPRERARRVAVVSQFVDPTLAFPVWDLVMMGRTPHIGLLGSPDQSDRLAVREALEATEAAMLARRRFHELSGGEQQRVVVAMALAQGAEYLLLDEPTVHLDLHHQHAMLELLRRLNAERGIGVLAVMHDLNLAALYFERLALMHNGHLVADGPASAVLTDPAALAVFQAPLRVVSHPQAGVPQVLLDRG